MTLQSLPRRRLLAGIVAGGALAGAACRLALAAAPGERRLAVVLLRGGVDGLAVVPPWRDPLYRDARRGLALPNPDEPDGVVDLDGRFGLHPALAPLAALYKVGELAVLQAVAS